MLEQWGSSGTSGTLHDVNISSLLRIASGRDENGSFRSLTAHRDDASEVGTDVGSDISALAEVTTSTSAWLKEVFMPAKLPSVRRLRRSNSLSRGPNASPQSPRNASPQSPRKDEGGAASQSLRAAMDRGSAFEQWEQDAEPSTDSPPLPIAGSGCPSRGAVYGC